MKRGVIWIVLTCLMVTSLVLASCAHQHPNINLNVNTRLLRHHNCDDTTPQLPQLPPQPEIGGTNLVRRSTAVQ